jgi:hypothetical protein
MANRINWFEIPSTDFERACKFYGEIFGADLQRMDMGDANMAMFPDEDGVTGAVIYHPDCKPAPGGPQLYLNGGEDLSNVLDKVESAGGTIVQPKTLVNEQIGYWASFKDTEGNLLYLHSIG